MAHQRQLEAADVTAAAPVGGRQLDGQVGQSPDLTPGEKHWAGVQARNYTLNRHGEDVAIFIELLDALGIDHDSQEMQAERVIQCSRCHQHKPETEFARCANRPRGRGYHCKACQGETWQQYKQQRAEESQ